MVVSFAEAVRALEARGQLTRHKYGGDATRLKLMLTEVFGPQHPGELAEFYGQAIASLGEFHAVSPGWSDRCGWGESAEILSDLMDVGAAPLFNDGCGNIYGLDLTADDATPAVPL